MLRYVMNHFLSYFLSTCDTINTLSMLSAYFPWSCATPPYWFSHFSQKIIFGFADSSASYYFYNEPCTR